ncbi:CG0192-related protein [Isoptericola aurantiacus]|uniref:CG0192-related protein n=1 Tax=Isoptericola aurantiacus TaxID=3377839 RepID=UPI00383BAB19
MAILHRATIAPTKAQLVADWLPRQPWFAGPAGPVVPVAAYRFDDPDGVVGIESHVFDVAGRAVHVPLTYRGAPLQGAEPWLVGTMEHSVLGTRWVYDAVGDLVYRAELDRVIREGDGQVELFVETLDGPQRREPTMHVRGSGADGVPADAEIVVVRDLTAAPAPAPSAASAPPSGVLTGTWPGQPSSVVLARLAVAGQGGPAVR